MSNNPSDALGSLNRASKNRKRRRKRKTSSLLENNVEKDLQIVESSSSQKLSKKTKFSDEADGKSGATSVGPVHIENINSNHQQDQVNNPSKSSGRYTLAKQSKSKVVSYKDSSDVEDYEQTDLFQSHEKSKAKLFSKATELLRARKTLPVFQHKDQILQYIEENQVTVIIGETGSGKSTQIPQFLMPNTKKQIAVTQPRRVAAVSLAARVSEEYGCSLGREVGYQVRFSNVSHPKITKLKYLTDGMLLREIMIDQELKRYSTIVIDEAHERTILTDLIIGFLKEIILSKKRPDLKIVVMSATLNAELFSRFFNNAPILYIEGKTYPVSKYYLPEKVEDLVDTMIRAILHVNMTEPEGDLLCFLPGQEEIDNCVSVLNQIGQQLPKDMPSIVPLPLYAALNSAQQQAIFHKLPRGKRKVIIATNIAETSITVSGVKYVIDSGLRKVKAWRHQLGLSTLLTTPISQASAKQRAGRAGRECPGKIFRLYLEDVFLKQLPKEQEPEIVRNDIILPVLTLKKLGIDDLLSWSWLEHPGEQSIISALSTLYTLGALNDNGEVTSLGQKISVLPLPPQLSVVLLHAFENGVLGPVIDIASCLSVDNLIMNVSGNNAELRDEVNFKRQSYSLMGATMGDLMSLYEFFSNFKDLMKKKDLSEAKSWCKELFFSFRGFKNALKIRTQLKEYMIFGIKQDPSLKPHEKEQQMRNLRIQVEDGSTSNGVLPTDHDSTDKGFPNRAIDTSLVLKSFLKGYVTNTAIGMPDRSYRICTTGMPISIHPSSMLFGKPGIDAIMYLEYVYTSKSYARNCSSIRLEWLQEVSPNLLAHSKESIGD